MASSAVRSRAASGAIPSTRDLVTLRGRARCRGGGAPGVIAEAIGHQQDAPAAGAGLREQSDRLIDRAIGAIAVARHQIARQARSTRDDPVVVGQGQRDERLVREHDEPHLSAANAPEDVLRS
jgi:hypothetical protein